MLQLLEQIEPRLNDYLQYINIHVVFCRRGGRFAAAQRLRGGALSVEGGAER